MTFHAQEPATVAGSADVDPRADVGAGTVVWHLAQVREGATVGRECVIATGSATETSGQARVSSEDGAPLLLNIHTEEGTLAKGDRAVIVDFDPEKHIYLVAKVKQEV